MRLKQGAIALSAAAVVCVNGLAQAADEAAGPAKTTDEEVIIESRKTTPQSVDPKATHTEDVITAKQLSNIPVTTDFIQALQYLPNVDVYEQGGNGLNGSNITINGFDQTRLNFTLDGIPINDNDSYSFYSNEFAQNLDIAQIRVTPSAGSATTIGLSAFGGSVDLLTKDPSATPAFHAMIGAGSFGTYSQYFKAESGEFFKDFAPTSAFVSFSHASSDGYFNNSSTPYKDSILFKSATQLGPGTLTLFFSQNSQEFHYYDGCQASSTMTTFPSSSLASGAAPVSYPTEATAGLSCNTAVSNANTYYSTVYDINVYKDSTSYIGYALDLGKTTIDNKVYYYYGHGFGGGATTFDGALEPERSYNNTNRIGDVLTATIPLLNALTLKTGLLFTHSNEVHDEPEFSLDLKQIEYISYDEPVITQTFEPYVNLTIQPVPQLIIDVGTRYLTIQRDFYENSAPGGVFQSVHTAAGPGQPNCSSSACFDKLLPSLGVNYEFTPGYHAYANITQNARPPGYSTFYAGLGSTQDLQLEKATTEEVGLVARSGNLEGRLSGFYTTYKNYILQLEEQEANSSTTGSRVVNGGDAKYYGASLALTYQFKEWLSGFLNAGVLHTDIGPSAINVTPTTVFDLPSTEADNAPRSTLAAGFEAHQGNLSGSVVAHYRGKRLDWGLDSFASDSGVFNYYYNKELPSITTLDASLGYNWTLTGHALKDIETKLIFTNITNVQKPTSYGANSFTDYEFGNPIIYLTEPFSVFATVQVDF